MPRYLPYSPTLLPAFVDFWNRAFADRRNFLPLTPEAFEARVVSKSNAIEAFDAQEVLLAVEGLPPRVVGVVHAGIWPEAFVRALDPAWKGGTRGYIALIAVDPDFRRRGIGSELWSRAATCLRGCRDIVIDGQCLNPFYGNSDGPETPFWGTPEGISVGWLDRATRRFFERRGYAPRHRASHLQWTPAPRPGTVRIPSAPMDYQIRILEKRYPEPGKFLSDPPRYVPHHPFTCVAAVNRAGRVGGLISFFPLVGPAGKRYAIYEWQVVAEMRNTGMGEALMAAAQGRLRALGAVSCDALTLPDLSPAAFSLYNRAGFNEVDAWAIY